jgi:two-component system nitrogen regulation sensor histidine kinase GlnL
MVPVPGKREVLRLGDHGPDPEGDLAGLTTAIDYLQGACRSLAGSVEGVNSDLEIANRRLADALKVRCETASYLADVVAGIPSGVIVVDREGRIVLFNRAAETVTGFAASEVIGRMYAETLGKEVSWRQTPLYTLATGCCSDQQEKELTSKSGEQVPVSSSTSLLGGESSLAGAVEVVVDLRRIKALEAEVDRVRTLAAMGELAAVVAHEIRNPLGGIKGFASLLERDLASSPDSMKLVAKIKEGIGSLEGIVNDLLEAGSSTKLRFSNTELTAEVRKVVEMCRMAAEGEGKAVEFEVSTPDAPVYCRVDAGRIRQALTNLMRNAVEAAGDCGRVRVRLRTGADPGLTPNIGKAPGNRLFLEVTDSGPGIPSGDADKVFTPFFTTKHGGTGLGLPTVRRIAGLHGGEVEYTRSCEGGSTFTMTIPRW